MFTNKLITGQIWIIDMVTIWRVQLLKSAVLTNFVILLSGVCFKRPTASMFSDYFDFQCFSDPVEDK